MAQQRMNVEAPINRLFAGRWSTRVFDSNRQLTDEQLARCLEAARWAPSCFGEQPWRFIVVSRIDHEDAWQALLESLAPKNRQWAKHAPLLIVAAAEPLFAHNGNANRWAEYDTGQALICLCLQAEAMGLATHQMGGFDADALKTGLGIPAQLHVMSVTALGYAADADNSDEELRVMEKAPRKRKALAEIVHTARWGESWNVPAASGWEARYQETAVECLPWFQAGIDADIAAALESVGSVGSANRLLDLGCGLGTQSVALAKQGFDVTATDISHSAIDSAVLLADAKETSITFHVDDVLDSKLSGPFDVILDRGLFHCFADEADQRAYLATVRRLLQAGGVLLLKCFHKEESCEMGPPGRYGAEDIVRIFADGFELIESHDSQFDSDVMEKSPRALFSVLRKK